jgi:hypothetical protein
VKTTIKFLICIFSAIVLAGCKKSFQESQLIGSWQLGVHVADARVTYYPNHTWVMIMVSSDDRVPSGSEFGEWKLDGNRLITITRYTFDNRVSNTSETGTIAKLNDSTLIEKTSSDNGQTKKSTFNKIEAPLASVSDDELSQKVIGTWISTYTNTTKLAGTLIYSIYDKNGSAHWHGTVFKESQSQPLPNADGKWRVENGYLVTAITNLSSNQTPPSQESRDQILSITDSQFTYRDEHGTIKKALRKND